jgi:hypothetical protein
MNEVWYSKQWDNSPMPHSIFFMRLGAAHADRADRKKEQNGTYPAH